MKDLFAQWSKVAWCFLALFLSGVVSLYSIVYGLASAVIHSGDVMYSHAVVAYETHVMAAAEARGLTPGVVNVGEPKLTRDEIIEREAKRQGLNPDLIRAVIHIESRGKKWQRSKAGAIGVMQVMPEWVSRMGLEHESQLYDDETNIKAGAWILGSNMKTYGGNVIRALQCYNGGPKLVGDQHAVTLGYAVDVINKMGTMGS